ncbi:sulfite exporter TauE/SafE family protein [Deinococcus peraridilitoris]|uniref:Probable membrane transporter protein n=1 Tax=Deinococcus peraridilitoris (strain DSM 19664 / LMG 22246 / CIP 109416 / KR-200) TaxID=937777 RepID=K9ZYG0_DEIPD|nr:sulfite exporter TauE/SafE family protein [Deinococcus peraridilitoris]AFZ66606.1 putative permease [Deinococcus peraridilitoris DSM 19664]
MLAWFGAIAIGLSLGLLGSGGSILTVPVLVYLVGEDKKLAIAESLAIVGLIAASGAVPYALRKLVDWRSVLVFGIPGMVGTFMGAFIGGFIPSVVQLLVFAAVMLIASWMMFRPPRLEEGDHKPRKLWKIALDGVAVGVLTGLVGVGGGFLIIPALVLLGGLSMHLAVGTSLLIIAMKSTVGFLEYWRGLSEQGVSMNWDIIVLFGVIGILGSFLGAFVSRFFSQQLLRRSFASFLVVIGAYILYTNVPGAIGGSQQAHSSQAGHATNRP